MFVAVAWSHTIQAAPPPGARAGSGKISVTTQPPGATVFVDGHPSGKAPTAVEGLGPGRYFVRTELDGYRPVDSVVELSSSQNSQSLSLELISINAPRPVEPAPTVVAVKPAPPAPVPVRVATPAPATPAPVRASTPPPATPVAVAPPRATPVPVPAPIPPPVSPETPGDADQAILELVAAHLKSISDGDVDAYVRLCAAKVDFYDEGMQSRDTIRRTRQKLKERWPVYEITNVRDVAVRAGDKPEVKRAAVTYDWHVSNLKTGKKAAGTASDLLDFKQTDGQWLIVKARQNVERKKSSR